MFKYFPGILGDTVPTKTHHLGEFPTGGIQVALIPKNQPIFQVSGGDAGSEKTDENSPLQTSKNWRVPSCFLPQEPDGHPFINRCFNWMIQNL